MTTFQTEKSFQNLKSKCFVLFEYFICGRSIITGNEDQTNTTKVNQWILCLVLQSHSIYVRYFTGFNLHLWNLSERGKKQFCPLVMYVSSSVCCVRNVHAPGLFMLRSHPACVSDQHRRRCDSYLEVEKVGCWWGVGWGCSGAEGVTEEMVKIERDSMDTMCNGSCSWENTQRKQGTLKPEGWKICRTSRRSDSLPYLIQFYKLSENMLLLSKLWGNALNMCAFILF